MEPVTGLAALLQTYGAWGLSALLIYAIWALYNRTSAIIDQRHQQFIDYLQTSGVTLALLVKSMEKVDDLLRDVKTHLESSKIVLDEVRRDLGKK